MENTESDRKDARDGTYCHIRELDVVSICWDVEKLLEQLSNGCA
jgi:hypothetical protein